MKNMKFFASVLALCPQAFCAMGSETVPPNVIYVFPDQFRNAALGVWQKPGFSNHVKFKGDPTHTPRLNEFARESVVLTSAMSNFPLSSPHRGSLLTGMYPNRSGVPVNCNSSRPFSYIRPETVCMGDVFSRAGYDCGYIGKLHADRPERNDPEHPGHYVEDKLPVWDAYTPAERRHGFNFWYSYGTFDVHKNPHYWDTNGKKHEPHEWSPLHEAHVAADYIRNKGGVRDAKRPFFLMVAMNPPHSPYRSEDDCMPEDYALYKDKPIDSLLVRDNAVRTMDKSKSAAYYFASVSGVDRAFGQILDALKEAGLEGNTIVVFASDHGETMCSQGTDDPKNSPYSESMNIPFMARYPGYLKPRVDSLLLSSPDIMPTVLGLAGLSKNIPATVQGRDYSSLFINGHAAMKRPDAALYIQNMDGNKGKDGVVTDYFPSARGIKTSRYTLAFYIDRKNKLKKVLFFDDWNDPYQMHNIAPETRKADYQALCCRLGELLKEIDDPWYKQLILNNLIKYRK